MKIPQHIWNTYKTFDPEASIFFNVFDEPEGSKILEVGSHDAPLSSMLASCGFQVYGVDLRERDQENNYTHIQSDFCKLPLDFYKSHLRTFDSAISISAIEHFGLNTYGTENYKSYYDIIAMRYVYDLLKPGGICYVSVPFGGKFMEIGNHWRVYDWSHLFDRIIQEFRPTYLSLTVCERMEVNGTVFEPGVGIPLQYAMGNLIGLPNISCFMKLTKNES